jgi:6-phosphogluconate dehydrogenase
MTCDDGIMHHHHAPLPLPLPAGPSLMPGGSAEAYKYIEPIVTKVAAQVDDGPCVMYIGDGGAGNYVKMVHNGIE